MLLISKVFYMYDVSSDSAPPSINDMLMLPMQEKFPNTTADSLQLVIFIGNTLN